MVGILLKKIADLGLEQNTLVVSTSDNDGTPLSSQEPLRGSNTVVICVNNTTLNELGTGGITRPVMFYAPAAGKGAEVRNAKPPHEVFPEY